MIPMIRLLILTLCLSVMSTGCRSVRTQSYPVPKMLDPVTEQVPNVIK